MSLNQFRFSCTLKDHDADVRGLCNAWHEKGGLLSCSRDKTTKLWIPNSNYLSYESKSSYIGHQKFVSCVAVMDPIKGLYPDGLILTGSNDKTINVYSPFHELAILSLGGHSNVVSSIKCGQIGIFYSSSWDQTVRVWQLDHKHFGKGQCVSILSGHNAAVWDVAMLPENKKILSASADKTIKLWHDGSVQFTYTGHTDCVRGLAVLSATIFLSCSNDATVKRWGINGECLQTYFGHKSFVYSIDIFQDRECFVTSGEDQTIKVWSTHSSNPIQTLPVPALSAWKVIVLNNGDVAVGCSDGSIRIFTSKLDRVADDQEKVAYEEELSKLALPEAGLNVGSIDAEKLKGPEALQIPGLKDGQTLLIRNGSLVEAYQWTSVDNIWIKVGDVVGSKGSSKSTFNGKEYDYVFTVDILEGAPPLHLPYNLSEDPWMAAQKFLDDNDLDQQFLDRVANFIIDNTKHHNSIQSEPSNLVDPFTGQGRYMPTQENSSFGQRSFDPFTGSGRYVPGSTADKNNSDQMATKLHDPMLNPSRYVPSDNRDAQQTTLTESTKAFHTINKYFPKFGYIFFEARNYSLMFKKLDENSREAGYTLSKEELENLKRLLTSPLTLDIDAKCSKLIWSAVSWKPSLIFPALDLIRCALISNNNFFELVCHSESGNLLSLILTHLQEDSLSINKLLAVRILCNIFSSSQGINFLFDSFDVIIGVIKHLIQTFNENNNNLFVAISTLLVNFAVSFNDTNNRSETTNMRLSCLNVGVVLMEKSNSLKSEAVFRLLVALGTLMYGHETIQLKASNINLKSLVAKNTSSFSDVLKVVECSNLIVQML